MDSSFIVSFSVFFKFFKLSKSTFFGSIKNFFLFKYIPLYLKISKFFTNFLYIKRYLFYIFNSGRVFSNFNKTNVKNRFSVMVPKYYFLNNDYQQMYENIKYFFIFNDVEGKNIMHNLKLVNHIFSKNVLNANSFINNFLSYGTNKASLMIKRGMFMVTYNNLPYRTPNNLKFKVGDSLKFSFSSKLLQNYVYLSMFKYSKYLSNLKLNLVGNLTKFKFSAVKKNFFKNRQILYSYMTYKNFEINFLNWNFIYIYNINLYKFNFFLKNFINLYSIRLYEWDRR